jgi:phenylpyruvate tautomerase PptA (4-oxalocrotonate tautomerase family)
MPLARIDIRKGKPSDFGKKVGEIVYQTMVKVINVPEKDIFQVISEHDSNGLIYSPDYLGIERTDNVIFVQITLNRGRTVEIKQAFYKALAENLNNSLGVRPEDIFINLVEVEKENWSFGNGIAQYVG